LLVIRQFGTAPLNTLVSTRSHVKRVESCRDVTWRAKWNLGLRQLQNPQVRRIIGFAALPYLQSSLYRVARKSKPLPRIISKNHRIK